MRAQIDPPHVAVRRRFAEHARAARKILRALGELREIGSDLAHRFQPLECRIAAVIDRLQRLLKPGACRTLVPAQLQRCVCVAQRSRSRETQITCRVIARRSEILPCHETARQLQARAEHVACEVDHLRAAERVAHELHTCFRKLMRFVEDRHFDARQQLGDAAVAQCHVGKVQVMVDDDEVGCHRFATRFHDVALPVLRAFRAKAVFACRRDERNDCRAFIEAVQLGQIAARRGLGPLLDASQRAHRPPIGQLSALARLAEPMQAEVTGAALQQRHADRHLQCVAQLRQVAQEKLILQALRRGAHQHASARQQGRNEVREGLADPGAGLGDEC